MLHFIVQKLLNKKWLISCMLIGTILLVAITVTNPLYSHAALQKMLTDELESVLEDTNEYPSYALVSGDITKASDTNYHCDLFDDPFTGGEALHTKYNINSLYSISLLQTRSLNAVLEDKRGDVGAIEGKVSYMSDLDDHIEIVYGNMYTDNVTDSCYECIISEAMLTTRNIVVGDVFTFKISGTDKNPVKVRVVGVFKNKTEGDLYWVNDPLSYDSHFFISKQSYENVFFDGNYITTITASYMDVFDYTKININDINSLIVSDNAVRDEVNGSFYKCKFNYENSFDNYDKDSSRVVTTMWIFQIPILILLAVFIFMVSNQIISIEQSEIAMLKSRGVSKKQLILAYLGQAAIISTIALIIGIPIGFFICVLFGTTKSFMEFSALTSIEISMTWTGVIYGVVATVIAIIIQTLPVLKYANFSIVEQKANKKKKKQSLWQKIFLDIILIIVSIYGYYSFHKQEATIVSNMQNGEALDPLLYFSSTIFILGTALFLLRILPLLCKLIFKMFKKKFGPSGFAAFMQVNKNISKQSFIIVFLVLTLALGIFNATTARSINENEETRVTYDAGSTLILKQKWDNNAAAVKLGYASEISYTEPDFTVYNGIRDKVKSITKVVYDDKAGITMGSEILKDRTTYMAITTNEFGLTGFMPKDATKYHWYYYLNVLTEDPYGAIISRNYAEAAGLKVGDPVMISRWDPLVNSYMPGLTLYVRAIVDAWPGYESTEYAELNDGTYGFVEHYLVVGNFDIATNTYGTKPYEIWINCDDTDFFYDFAAENHLTYEKFIDTTVLCDEIKEQPFFQVTSGMLTIAFVVVLILSMIGFLIYWITSIKSRELMFGIYRAMGMSMSEIIRMLIIEHLFGSLLPILYGVVVGVVASKLFVPLIQLAYISSYSTLKANIIISAFDMIRLSICIVIMLGICFYLLGRILSKMKITQALKLGED